MDSSEDMFKKGLSNAYVNDPTVSKQFDVMKDMFNYSSEMSEENSETTEITGSGSSGAFSAPLFGDGETTESEKIPGGMSKNMSIKDIAKKHSKKDSFDKTLSHLKSEIVKGTKVEMEHTSDPVIAFEIAKDHLSEDPDYYNKLKKIESNEATTSASVGAYSTPAFVAKNDKNWRGGKKPIYKGGKFAQVKKKCLTFPYCNQGAGAVAYKDKSSLDEAVKNASSRLGVEEQLIKRILYNHFKKKKK